MTHNTRFNVGYAIAAIFAVLLIQHHRRGWNGRIRKRAVHVDQHVRERAIRSDDKRRCRRTLAGVQLVAAWVRSHPDDGIHRRRPHVTHVANDRPAAGLAGHGSGRCRERDKQGSASRQ